MWTNEHRERCDEANCVIRAITPAETGRGSHHCSRQPNVAAIVVPIAADRISIGWRGRHFGILASNEAGARRRSGLMTE
jgi:hypothetical protein